MKMRQFFLVFVSLLVSYGLAVAKYSLEKTDPTECCNGFLTASATGNTGPYTFEWTKNGNVVNGALDSNTSSILNNVCAGTYFVTIRNGYGCETILDISFPSTLYTIEKVDPIICCTGSVTATATENCGPYSFVWTKYGNTVGNAVEDNTSSTLNNVCQGTYKVTITDGDGIQTSLSITFPVLPVSVCEEEFTTLQLIQPPEVRMKVFLEGAYNPDSLLMRTKLMERGLLPGQTPVSDLVSPTPAGQPYKNTSFGYNGNEGIDWDDEDYTKTGNVVDWVLVSIKKDITGPPLQTRAAILLEDGSAVFPNPFSLNTVPSAVMFMVEHRNHLPIISNRVELQNGTLTCDLTICDSFSTIDKAGQKLLDTGVWAMLAGNGSTILNGFDIYDIRGGDKSLWAIKNGQFDQYQPGDMNLDGDVNGLDKKFWFDNNGKTGMKLQ